MKCPYQIDLGCPYVDSLDMSKAVECSQCRYYENGVRPTGATPLLAWILKKLGYKPKYKPTDDDIFMMGL